MKRKAELIVHGRKKAAVRAGVTTLLLGLTCCDPVYGIFGASVSSTPPDGACILAALRETPGVRDVREQTHTNEGWIIFGDGPKHGEEIQYYIYTVGPDRMQSATFMVEPHSNKTYLYRNYMMSIGEKLPEQEIYQSYPILVNAGDNVSRHCRLDIAKTMGQHCFGYDCSAVSQSINR